MAEADNWQESAKDTKLNDMLARAGEVAREVENLRDLFRDPASKLRTKNAAKGRLLKAAERLSNLMGLILTHLATANMEVETRIAVAQQITTLQDRITKLGTTLLIEQLAALKDRAEAILSGDQYPLGCVFPMRQELTDFLATIDAVRGREPLPPQAMAVIRDAVAAFNKLVEFERRYQLPSFDPEDAAPPDLLRPITRDEFPGLL